MAYINTNIASPFNGSPTQSIPFQLHRASETIQIAKEQEEAERRHREEREKKMKESVGKKEVTNEMYRKYITPSIANTLSIEEQHQYVWEKYEEEKRLSKEYSRSRANRRFEEAVSK